MKKIRNELKDFGVNSTVPSVAGAVAAQPEANAPLQAGGSQPASSVVPPATAAGAAAAVSGVGSGTDRATALQAEVTQLQTKSAEVQRGAQAYAAGQQYLRRAEAELKSAAGSLTVTQGSGATEAMQDLRMGPRGGGLFGPRRGIGRPLDRRNDMAHNVIEVATIQKANKHMKEAAQNIQQARQQLPNLPFIQPANVQQAMGGVFFNALLAPGLIGDVMQQAKVNKAKSDVQQMQKQVTQALDWCTNSMNAAQAEASQVNTVLQMKQSELSALAH